MRKERRGADGGGIGPVGAGGVMAAFLAAVSAACGFGTPSAAAVARSDPPLLVPWSRIGDIELGESRTRVEREYGGVGHGYHLQVRTNGIVQGYYRLHGNRVFVTFEDG